MTLSAKQAAKKKFWAELDDHLKEIIDTSSICLDELAGYVDGDGSIYVSGQQHMACGITQCSYKTLRKIQDIFGGIIRKRDPKKEGTNRGKQRFQYTLVFRGLQVVPILHHLKDRLIRKSHKAHVIMNMMTYYGETSKDAADARRALHETFSQGIPDYDRVTWGYIRGLFEAEGCLRSHSISICQKDDLVLLEKIKEFLENHFGVKSLGYVDDSRWVTRSHETSMVVHALRAEPMFHQEKTDQIEAYLAKDFDRLTALKHVNEDVPQEIIDQGNNLAKELVQKIRVAWHNSFESNTKRPAKDRQPKQFHERAPKLSEDQIRQIIELRSSTSMSLQAIADRVGGSREQITYTLKKHKKNPL